MFLWNLPFFFFFFMTKVRETWHFNGKKTNRNKEFVCLSLSSINNTCTQHYFEWRAGIFSTKGKKADKVMIPVAFCFWATEEDLRLEHIPWLTWWDVIGSSTRACSQYYGVFRLPSSAQFPELTAVFPPPWHFLKKKKDIEKKSSNRDLRKCYTISVSTKQLKPDVKIKRTN